MKTKLLSIFVALATATVPLRLSQAALFESSGAPRQELTRDEQIDALKTEIELRKAALGEVRTAIINRESGRSFDKFILALSTVAIVGVWFLPNTSLVEKSILAALNTFGVSSLAYKLNLNSREADDFKEQLAITQIYINKENEQLSLLLHAPHYSLTRDEQISTLNSSIQLRQAAITDVETRLSKAESIGFIDGVVIAGSAIAGTVVWFLPPATIGLFSKQLVSVFSWLYALSRTSTVVVARKQVPVLREQLDRARDYMIRDEQRLSALSGISTLAN